MILRRKRNDDDPIPDRDSVEQSLAAKEARAAAGKPGDGVSRMHLSEFRPTIREIAPRLIPTLLIAGLLAAFMYGLLTPVGSQQMVSKGAGTFMLEWLLFVALCTTASLVFLAIMRSLSSGLRRFSRREVARLAVEEALAAAAGATFAAFWLSSGAENIMGVLASTFVFAFLFSWSVLMPLSVRSYDANSGADD